MINQNNPLAPELVKFLKEYNPQAKYPNARMILILRLVPDTIELDFSILFLYILVISRLRFTHHELPNILRYKSDSNNPFGSQRFFSFLNFSTVSSP